MSEPVRAAGGVPWRQGPVGTEVLLIHRRRYGDWTFPKGKLEAGESEELCALREVEEETGLTCALGRELPSTAYRVGERGKVVRYWEMEPVQGVLVARPGEIDEATWVALDEARALLTYDHDREVLDALAAGLRPGG